MLFGTWHPCRIGHEISSRIANSLAEGPAFHMRDIARRLLWHANRTPLAHLIKLAVAAAQVLSLVERRRLAQSLEMSILSKEKAELLRRDGYVSLTDIVDEELLALLDSACQQKLSQTNSLAEKQESNHKQYWLRLLDSEIADGAFDAENIYVKFAIQSKFVEFLCGYMGSTPQLMDVLLTYSQPSDANLSYSQLWHRDHDDLHTVKIFVYLSNVTSDEQGPFTFLPGPPSDKLGFQLKSHMDDNYFYSRVSQEEVVELKAPRLSIFACETSRCYHMGSRVQPGTSRLMYTATFIRPPCVYPRKTPRFRANRPLKDIERSILGL